jgi:Ca-activated chloride channel family protein
MRLLLPISVSLLLAALAAHAQTAEDFFNSGAQLYISNNIPSALEKTEDGLKIYPDDVKLKKLEELLKQQQQQQQSQQNQQQNQSQQNSSGQKNQQQQNQQQQNSQGQQKSDEQKQNPPEQPKPSPEKMDGKNPEDKNADAQPVAPGQMTPAEAKQLLDAQKGDEQLLSLKPQEKPQDNQKPVKDW